MGALYTIGHSQHKQEVFLKLLKEHQIEYVLDVRSVPYSKFAPQYNQEDIRQFLFKNDIQYVFKGNSFGARQDDLELYTQEGYLDFKKVILLPKFQQAIEYVLSGIQKNRRIALMCVEKNPVDCHRTILVAKAFFDRNIDVGHIMDNSSIKKQEDINNILINMYFPNRDQGELFGNDDGKNSDLDYLESAYQRRNKDIGYHLNLPKNQVI